MKNKDATWIPGKDYSRIPVNRAARREERRLTGKEQPPWIFPIYKVKNPKTGKVEYQRINPKVLSDEAKKRKSKGA